MATTTPLFLSMACRHPMVAHRTFGRTKNGRVPMKFICKASSFSGRWGPDLMMLPCRQCIGCRLEQSRQAAIRLVHELKFWPYSGFLTLTYDDGHLPAFASLDAARWTKFARDLRDRFSYRDLGKLKFFAVGEYGDESLRPHYHAIVFAEAPLLVDQVEPSRTGCPQFESPHVSAVWPDGRHRISEVTFESAAYCARYVLKKINGGGAFAHYGRRAREFVRWPKGLGKGHFERWWRDIYPSDQVCLPGRGSFLPPPYYDRLLEKLDPVFFSEIKLAREERSDKCTSAAEWFGRIEVNLRTDKVQLLRQAAVCPRSAI